MSDSQPMSTTGSDDASAVDPQSLALSRLGPALRDLVVTSTVTLEESTDLAEEAAMRQAWEAAKQQAEEDAKLRAEGPSIDCHGGIRNLAKWEMEQEAELQRQLDLAERQAAEAEAERQAGLDDPADHRAPRD